MRNPAPDCNQPAATIHFDSPLWEVARERARQDAKWGEQNHADADPTILGWLDRGDWWAAPERVAQRLAAEHEIPTAARARQRCQERGGEEAPDTWTHILVEEVAEAVETIASRDPTRLRAELIQVAAVAVAWAEAIDRRTRQAAGENCA